MAPSSKSTAPVKAQSKRETQSQAIGKSRGSITTKILALTDALGKLADFCLLPGQAHNLRGVTDLLDGLAAGHMLADRAFDADWLRDALSQRDIAPVIPPQKNRKHTASYDEKMYKWRHLVENFFQKIKDYRVIATRYCKTDSSFTAFISLAATILWLK